MSYPRHELPVLACSFTTMLRNTATRAEIPGFNRRGRVMKLITAFAAATTAVTCALLWPRNAVAQSPIPLNPKIHIQYAQPRSALFAPIRQGLVDRKILEEYSQVMSPVKLPEDLIVSTEECPDARVNSDYCTFADECRPGTNAPHAHYIRICYEYLAMVQNESAMPNEKLPPEEALAGAGLLPGFTRGEVIVGGTSFVLMHETGHAVFDIQNIPRLGHEEDAADQFAGFMMLQFGKPTALTMVKGAINVDHTMRARYGFSSSYMQDVHSLDDQRLANILCLAYGSPLGDAFTGLAQSGLPEARRPNCAFEYKAAETAFGALDIDKPLFEKVRQLPILQPGDQ